jgi:hypothetical protein
MLDKTPKRVRRILPVLIVLAAIAFITTIQSPLPEHLTKIDFRAYWGASRLLANSENFSDPELMHQIQQENTDAFGDETLMTWNPPWLLSWLLPYAVLPLDRSSWLWFLTNIVLIYSSVVLLWRIFCTNENSQRKIWIPFILTFIYIPTLTTLLVGQITGIVLFGLAGFLYFDHKRKFFVSGAFLALTTIKPQLVFVTLPILLLELIRRRRWRAFIGFLFPILIGTALVFLFRPTFVPEYIESMSGSALTRRIVPTIPFVLSEATGMSLLQSIGVPVVLVAIVWWNYRQRKRPIAIPDLLIVTLLLSMLFTPFAWSFDALVLILPLIRLSAWAVEGKFSRPVALSLLAAFITANVLALYLRTLQVWDWSFFWFPAAMIALYFCGWWFSSDRKNTQNQKL